MATITKLVSAAGAVSFVAQVRIKPFKPCQKTFRVVTTTKAARKLAADWGKAEEKRLREEFEKGQSAVIKDLSRFTVGGLINEYLAEPEVTGLKTFKEVDRLLTWWLKEHVATRVLDFNVPTIRAARDNLRSEKQTPATANRYISAMRACWNWGRNAGLIPMDRLWPQNLLMTEPAGRTKFLTDAQLAALLEVAEPNPMMHAAILLSVGTGIREGELLGLHWQNIDLDGGKLTLLKTKNGTARTVHVPATAIAALRVLKKAKVVSTMHVFLIEAGVPLKVSTLQKRWKKMFKDAGIADFHWHDLRHSCASFLARRGASLLEIGSVLGHKSPSMTYRYAHLVQGQAVKGHAELDALLGGK